jgi:membrane associated rhomboid family serine protease
MDPFQESKGASPDHHSVRPRREPIFNVPLTIIVIAVALAAIYLWESFVPEGTRFETLMDYGFVPARELSWLFPDSIHSIVQRGAAGLDEAGVQRYELAVYLMEKGDRPHLYTFLTYAFLHLGWLHAGLNVVMLAALGTPVMRRFGTLRFLVLLTLGAICGALAHAALNFNSVIPVIGASAAVSAAMGAATRFVFDPIARLGGSAPGLLASLRNRSVIAFTIAWFFANALSGLGVGAGGLADVSVAWESHIGGFLLGLLGFAVFDPHRSREAMLREDSPEDLNRRRGP